MSKLIKCVTENFSTEEELTEVSNIFSETFPTKLAPRFLSSFVTTLKLAVRELSDRQKKTSA